ncbi:unnamed protein product, partial [Heterosigma akashiwo]
ALAVVPLNYIAIIIIVNASVVTYYTHTLPDEPTSRLLQSKMAAVVDSKILCSSCSSPDIVASSFFPTAADYRRSTCSEPERPDYGWFEDLEEEDDFTASMRGAQSGSSQQEHPSSIFALMGSVPTDYPLPSGCKETSRIPLHSCITQFKHYQRVDGQHLSNGRIFAWHVRAVRVVVLRGGWGGLLPRRAHAEYQVVAACGGDLYVAWKRHGDFRALARR